MQPDTFLYQTKQIGLRPLSSMELDGPYPDWFLDSDVNAYNSHLKRPASEDSVRDFVASLKADRTKWVLAIYWLEPTTHIGNISLQQIDHFNRSAEIAFLLGDKRFWGKGVAQAAAELLMTHGEEKLNIRRFHLGCLAANMAMNRLAEKLGFAREGQLQQALFHNGEFVDVNLYGRLVRG